MKVKTKEAEFKKMNVVKIKTQRAECSKLNTVKIKKYNKLNVVKVEVKYHIRKDVKLDTTEKLRDQDQTARKTLVL